MVREFFKDIKLKMNIKINLTIWGLVALGTEQRDYFIHPVLVDRR